MDFVVFWCENVHVASDPCGASHALLTAACHSQVSIAVGLVGFACFLLLVLFVLINKYGRRSKFGMKGKSALLVGQQQLALCRVFIAVGRRVVAGNLSVWLVDKLHLHLFQLEPY